MEQGSGGPAIYWVVGNGTDVGKTTVATALIKVLNARGERTIGFKPYAASLLLSIIDFMVEKYPLTPCKLFGNDAWELTMASPLTGPEMIDLVAPIQLLCYPNWQSAILVRGGSLLLDNVEYLCSDNGAALRDRTDFQALARVTGLPLGEAVVRDGLGLDEAAHLSPEKPKQAFARLLDLGVDAVVCEGAGKWLPLWQDCPAANHVLEVADGRVLFCPDLDFSLPFDPTSAGQGRERLSAALNAPDRPTVSSPLYLAEAGRRAEMAQRIVKGLLAKASPRS